MQQNGFPNTGNRRSSRRVAQELAEELRKKITAGGVRAGAFLPSVRELMREHGSASLTVQKALKILEAEGLVLAEPRQGYRVLARANEPSRDCPVAFLLTSWQDPGLGEGFYRTLTAELHDCALKRGWKFLGMMAGKGESGEIFGRVEAERSWGLVLDTPVPGLIRRAREAGLPVVVVDGWVRGAEYDAVVQDDFAGGQRAGEYLAERGHKRIGWIGPAEPSEHERGRRGGALVALAEAGLQIGRSIETEINSPEAHEAARKLLAGRKRPTGVLALWRPAADVLKEAARDAGLVVGQDVDIVTWTTEEAYRAELARMPEGGVPLPTVVWSLQSMAEAALSRLAERRGNPDLPAMRVNVPTHLEVPAEGAS
jgi:DNA-binding LacI/PurR family transcriptional regulator